MTAGTRLEVDGEVFEVVEVARGVWNYTWVSGPAPGYGFRSAGDEGLTRSAEEHVQSVRMFLADIDPETGHLSD